MKSIAEKLEEIRRETGWTQLDLALEIKCHPFTVSKWERGISQPVHFLRAAIDQLYLDVMKGKVRRNG